MYADIIVDISHDKLDKTFQYRVPDRLLETLEVGMRVNVPFGKGNKMITGFVVYLTSEAEFDVSRMKEIDSIVDEKVAVEGKMIQLAAFIRKNYGGSMNQALKTVIPVKESVRTREKKTIRLSIDKEEARNLLEEFNRRHAVARARLMEILLEEEVVEYSLVTTKLNIGSPVIRFFEENGYITVETEEYYRNPVKKRETDSVQLQLNPAQKQIVEDILSDYEKGIRNTYLIRGVTGSGKTEVYMSVIEKVLEEGKQVIMLIPEIALTFQTVMRFYKRFGDEVSIMHSRLSKGERYDQYVRAKKGLVRIMIGPRSALFTPFENLGLIVIMKSMKVLIRARAFQSITPWVLQESLHA